MDTLPILPDFHARRILVVEDDFEIADRLVAPLRGAGFYVQNAYNVGDALAVEHTRFDLAVVDGQMRDRQGVTLLQRASEHPTFKQLSLLIIGDPGRDALQDHGEALQRNFTDADLLDGVRKAMERPSRFSTRPLTTQAELASESRLSTDSRRKLLSEDDIPTEPTRINIDSILQQQLAELRILSNLGRSISSVLELSEVLNQIVEAATTLTRAEEGLLLLPDPVGKALYLRAMKGIDDQSARNFRIKTEDPLIGRVYRSGEPILRSQHGPQRVKTEYFVQSLLYVPLAYKEQVIGVLGVNNRQTDRPFTQHDQELLLDLAAHAAIAIENAQLYEDRLLQNRQLSLLVSAGKTLSSTLSLSEVLTILCQQMIQTVGVNECTISQHDEQTNDLVPVAAARYMIWAATGAPRKSVDAFKIGAETPDERKAYIFRHSLERHLKPSDRMNAPYWAKHSLVMPIHGSASTSVGVLELHYLHSAPNPSDELIRPLRSLLGEIMGLMGTTTVQSSGTLLNLLQKILEQSRAPWLSFYLRADPQTFFKVIEYGTLSLIDEPPIKQQPILYKVRDFARATLIDYSVHDPALPTDIKEMMAQSGVESMLSVRLTIKGKLFGAVTLSHLQPGRRFRSSEISLASALVTQAASALENARLFSDLEDSLRELKQTQASLVQAARLSTMGELAAVVAHQINNPLATILADAEIILQDIDEQDPSREGLTAIRRAGVRAHTVVKRLLSTARRDISGDSRQLTNAHETIQHTLDLITTHIERSHIKIEVALDSSATAPVFVLAAPGHLEDLWLNLLLNARDAVVNTPGGLIRIETECSAHTIAIRVTDNGPGIPNESMDHLFEPFFTTKPSGEGTGLGLYVCKQIVEGCHGAMYVETAPGQGAQFVVTLPTVVQK